MLQLHLRLPNNIIFDHCYIHGHSQNLLGHGILLDGNNIAVVDSYISEIHFTGDSQAILMYAGGPKLIQNNFLEATTENILTGGGSDVYLNLQPYGLQSHDVTIYNNWLYKTFAGNGWYPCQGQTYDGSWFGNYPDEKNLYEDKAGARYDMEGNVLQNSWAAAQPGLASSLNPY